MTTTEFQQAALDLPKQQQAQFAQLLLKGLDQQSVANIEQLWLHEAKRHAAEIDRGEV